MDIFWIGAVDDQWDTVGNWSDSSGGAANASSPADGDEVKFDTNSAAGTFPAPVAGPGAPWTGGINQTGHGVSLSGIFANITITSCRFEDTIFDGAFSGGGSFQFLGATCSNESAATAGSFNFTDGSTNNGVLTGLTAITFGNATNAASVTSTAVTVSGTTTTSATVTGGSITVSGEIQGGTWAGPVTITATGSTDGTVTITGAVTIQAGGSSEADITGNVTNAGSILAGAITGNVVCNAGGVASGVTITGTLTMNTSGEFAGSVAGLATFNGTSKNTGTCEGNAAFNGTSKNAATVEGDATFASGALNHDGATLGTVEGTVETPGVANGANWTHGLGGYIGDIQLTGITAGGGASTNVFGLAV